MKATIIESKYVCTKNDWLEIWLGHKHYKLGVAINFEYRHKIVIRIMLIKWHLMLRLFEGVKQ